MKKLTTTMAAAALLLMAQPAWSAARVAVGHFAPFAADVDSTQVSIRTAGGDVVNGLVGVPYGVDRADPEMYTAKQLTRPFPCVDAE